MRVACVGAGYFAQFHYGSWRRLEKVSLCGACDQDFEKAEATGLRAYTDLEEMLWEQNPGLLDIIVPPAAHAETIRTALKHGVRQIICQKPFCRSLEEARAIHAEAEAAGATIIVHENFRFQPWYRAIKSALNSGEIGQVMQVTFRLRPGDGQGPKAYLDRQPYFQKMQRFLVHETAVHWIDTFRFLLGEPTGVYADLRQLNPAITGEDAGYVIFDFPGGVRALFDGNRHLDHAADNLRRTMGEAQIEGTHGEIRLYGDGSVDIRPFSQRAGKQLLPPDTRDGFGGDCVHAVQSHVVDSMLKGTTPENSLAEYLRVIEIEQAIYASAETGKKISLDLT